jgi:DUF438 domain-containing protein
MVLSPKTTISELLKEHPFLVEFLVAYNPKFSLLKNKVMLATVGKMATLKRVSGIGDVPLDQLIADIAAEIEQQTGGKVEVENVVPGGEESRAAKAAELKAILTDLHAGVPFGEVKQRFDAMIAEVDHSEIVALEQQLIADGMPAEEVKRLSDLHVSIFKDALDGVEVPQTPPGHPVDTFVAENQAFTAATADMELLLEQLRRSPTAARLDELGGRAAEILEVLARIEVHYQRKENQLFPFLEQRGITAPPQVMWAVDDDIRAQLKQTRAAIEAANPAGFVDRAGPFVQAVSDMVYKENHILLPIALESLEENDWVEIRRGEPDIGYAFDGPAADWPGAGVQPAAAASEPDTGLLELDTGELTLKQTNLLLKHLPVDLTFVDEHDDVRYFSAGKERLFPRSPGIIGRAVQQCHPPKSIDTVNRIVGAFKSGKKDEAAFWIELGGRMIYIRYFAVRDDDGAFKGTLEVSQDITEIKTIAGQRRLLDWDD